MTPHTATLPPTDRVMWRKLLRRAHPDQGGDHDLFIWVRALQEHVDGQAIETKRRPFVAGDRSRVPFEYGPSFDELTAQALRTAEDVGEPFASLLWLLADCRPAWDRTLVREQEVGAKYARLAAIGHIVGMTKRERIRWYRIAESIPLADQHAGHILDKLDRGKA